jgi:hypothetical protein
VQNGAPTPDDARGIELRIRGIELRITELLLAKGIGPWAIGEFERKVVGGALVLIPVEFASGVRGC